MRDQKSDLAVRVVGTGMVLPDVLHVAPGHVVEPQRCGRRSRLRDMALRLLALGALYRFRFAAGPGLR